MASPRVAGKTLQLEQHVVMSKRNGEDFVETKRTDRKVAEHDVRLFKEICRRVAWIAE